MSTRTITKCDLCGEDFSHNSDLHFSIKDVELELEVKNLRVYESVLSISETYQWVSYGNGDLCRKCLLKIVNGEAR